MINFKKRPWQGIVLIVLQIITLVGIIIGTIMGLSVWLKAYIMSQVAKIAVAFYMFFPIILTVSFILVIIFTLLIAGLISGKKIAPVVVLIFSIFNLLSGVVGFFKMLFIGQIASAFLSLIGLAVVMGVIWLAIACLKHPFYGGNGKITLDTFKFWKKRISGGEEMTTF
jgi:hypothetical protein